MCIMSRFLIHTASVNKRDQVRIGFNAGVRWKPGQKLTKGNSESESEFMNGGGDANNEVSPLERLIFRE